jgi:putative transposase
VRQYRTGVHTKYELLVHLVWIPKYRKKLQKPVRVRVRDVLRKIAYEHDLRVVSGKVASDHVHMLVSYRPNQDVSKIVQWLKGISSRVILQEFPRLRKQFWGRHFWARGYFAASAGSISDEMIKQYIEEQAGEQMREDDDFQV